MKLQPRISVRRIALLTLPFLLLLLIAYAVLHPDPRVTRREVGLRDLPIEFVLPVFLPSYTTAFAVAAGLWLRSRLRRGERVACSWIAVTRVTGCFVGVGLCLIAAYGLATGYVVTGSPLGDAGIIGTLGLLLAFPWRAVASVWLWWSCFAVFGVFFLFPAALLVWLSYLLLDSTSRQPGAWLWLWASYAIVAFIGVQVLAVWKLRKRSLT